MTVEQLIAKLQSCPPDAIVRVEVRSDDDSWFQEVDTIIDIGDGYVDLLP